MTHIPLELDALKDKLSELGYAAKQQSDTAQLVLPIQADDLECPLFFKAMASGGLLQMVTFFPETYEPGVVADLARLLHVINRQLDLPGLGMDEASQTFFYRLMLPAVEDKIEVGSLEAFVKAMKHVCEMFGPTLMAVATGSVKLDAILAELGADD